MEYLVCSDTVLKFKTRLVFVLSCVCYVFVRICLYVFCGHLLGKGWPLGSRLWCLLWVCHFPIGILGQVWYSFVWIPDLCTLTYFDKVILPEWYILAEIYWKDNVNTGTGKMRKSIETVHGSRQAQKSLCDSINKESRIDTYYYPLTKSEGYSFGVVGPSSLFVRPEPYLSTYWSDLIHWWYKW